jgi:hypothetical protein
MRTGKEANKTTRGSEWRSVLGKEKKEQKNKNKDLTGPPLLEMSGKCCQI